MPLFERSSWIAAPVETVFSFHERQDAFEALTPPWQRVEIVSRSAGLQIGARLVIRLRLGPFSKIWIAEHTAFERNLLFVDEQIAGPFRSWRHYHRFSTEGAGARLTDSIEYSLPGGKIADILAGWIVQAQLRKMFAYRHLVTRRECEALAAGASQSS